MSTGRKSAPNKVGGGGGLRWTDGETSPQAGLSLRKWSPGQLRNQITSSSSFLYPPPSVRECVFVCVSVGWGDVVKEADLNKQCITYIE